MSRALNSQRAAVAASIVLVLLAIVLPWAVSGNFWLHLGVMIFINALMALSVNVVLKTGQVSLAFTLTIRASDRTLTAAQATTVRDNAIAAATQRFSARMRGQ